MSNVSIIILNDQAVCIVLRIILQWVLPQSLCLCSRGSSLLISLLDFHDRIFDRQDGSRRSHRGLEVRNENQSLSINHKIQRDCKKQPPTSSRNGVNFGVPGTTIPAADSGTWSTNGVKPRGPASPAFLVGTGGGGIMISPAGTGASRNGTIFEPDPEVVIPEPEPELDAILLERPACFRVVPANFFTSGTFSLIRVLRVPRSSHAFVALLLPSAACASEPEGSTNIWMRLLDDEVGFLDVLVWSPRDEGVRTDKDAGEEDAVVARACLAT